MYGCVEYRISKHALMQLAAVDCSPIKAFCLCENRSDVPG